MRTRCFLEPGLLVWINGLHVSALWNIQQSGFVFQASSWYKILNPLNLKFCWTFLRTSSFFWLLSFWSAFHRTCLNVFTIFPVALMGLPDNQFWPFGEPYFCSLNLIPAWSAPRHVLQVQSCPRELPKNTCSLSSKKTLNHCSSGGQQAWQASSKWKGQLFCA